jgi:hypothetical protein
MTITHSSDQKEQVLATNLTTAITKVVKQITVSSSKTTMLD